MKKIVYLVFLLAVGSALALQLPVLAEDNEISNTSAVPTSTTNNLEASSTPELKPEPKQERVQELAGLEKIPSPDKINLFTQIKKVGKDLFGVRKASSTIANIQKNDDKKVSSATNELMKKIEEAKKKGLEKIISLDQVKFFDKITKIGNDLFGLKKKGVYVLPALNAEQQACVASAIDAKDTKVSEAATANATAVAAAISARGTCQKEALSLVSGHEEAIKACNQTFQISVRAAAEKVKNTQKTTWETYRVSLKECSNMANSAEIMIEDGGNEMIK